MDVEAAVTMPTPRRKGSRRGRARGANPHRPTQAQTLARQKQIVIDRDADSLTWAEIAAKHGLGEKEARQAYSRFKSEIVPVITEESSEAPHDYFRMIEETRARLLKIADQADNSSAAVGALREVMRSIFKEVELAQSLGLLPREAADEPDIDDFRWLLDQFATVLARYPIPVGAIEEIRTLARGDGEAR
jgi:hypothetical protein